jgi:hypothetical protein
MIFLEHPDITFYMTAVATEASITENLPLASPLLLRWYKHTFTAIRY